ANYTLSLRDALPISAQQFLRAPQQLVAARLEASAVAVAQRELELEHEAVLDEEPAPVVAPGILLRRAADGVVAPPAMAFRGAPRSEEHTSELQSREK